MEETTVHRVLLQEVLVALNDIPNQVYGGLRWQTTYQLAAELSRVLKTSRESRRS